MARQYYYLFSASQVSGSGGLEHLKLVASGLDGTLAECHIRRVSHKESRTLSACEVEFRAFQ